MTEAPQERMMKRSVVVAEHRTSVSLENIYWEVLQEAAEVRAISVNNLVTEIDQHRSCSLSGAIRLYVLAVARAEAEGRRIPKASQL